MKNQGLWDALAYVYLTEEELRYYSIEDENPLSQIKQRIYDDIWKEMREYGEREPPFLSSDSKYVKYGRKAKIIETNRVNTARMKVESNGFKIFINNDIWHRRKRTLIAHELGHTYLYDLDTEPIEPYYEKDRVADYLRRREEMWHMDEGFSWDLARQLVVPTPVLDRYIPKTPSLYSFFRNTKKRFEITYSIMLKRLYWSTYNWDKGANYWNNSVFLVYPDSKIDEDDIPAPKGNTEVYKGAEYKNITLKESWDKLKPVVKYSLHQPNKLITPDEVMGISGYDTISTKNSTLRAEAKYLPNAGKLYILLIPEESLEQREHRTLKHRTLSSFT
ncbi:MAG: hypothetical protein U5J64_07995 [Halobacteriales archaeon]|nr:hypothetical protein [Halobacteriales archaeon]